MRDIQKTAARETISDRVLGDLKVSYNVVEQSANSCSPCPPLFDMFGPSTKASTHAFATICGCPKRYCNIFRALPSPPGTPSKPATALLAGPSRNCNKRDIFGASEMFWVSTISSKCDLNLKYSQGLPENLTTSKGGRPDLVTIESILVVSFMPSYSQLQVWETIHYQASRSGSKAILIKGVASGFLVF